MSCDNKSASKTDLALEMYRGWVENADDGLWTRKLDISFRARNFHFSGKREHFRKCSQNA